MNDLKDDQKNDIKILLLEKQQSDDETLVNKEIKELIFEMTDDTKEFKTEKNVAIAIIDHDENELDKDASILIKVILGKENKIENFLRVSPYGVLPNFERDIKRQHSQMMGWVKPKKRWAKVPLVKTKDGSLALPIVIMEDFRKKN